MSDSGRMNRDERINLMWQASEVFDLLASERLIRLENRGYAWAIVHKSHDGESTAEILDKDFNRLIRTWADVHASLETYAMDNA